jgi:teichuronic acid biosynthesis protein TuaE
VTLTVGWTALAIKWNFERDAVYLKILACLPVACVVLGVFMQAAHLHSLYATANGTSRLAGASEPAQLALTSFIACVTASICYRTTRWRFAPLLVIADGVILALTVSRGAAIALGIAMAWPALRFAFGGVEREGVRWVPQRWFRIAFLGGALAAVAALIVPSLIARDKGALTYIPGRGFVHDATSGRAEAWHEFYSIAEKSRWFGHGLGSGPITKITQQGFLAQHNEFLRLFLEGGYIGGGLVLAAIILVIGTCVARAPRWMRFDLLGLAIGFAVLSYTDNTLTSVNLQVHFCLVFGLVATASSRSMVTPAGRRDPPVVSLDRPIPALG